MPEPAPVPSASRRGPPVSGRLVVLTVLAVGVTLVLGVGTFAALTRPPRKAPSAAGSASAAPTGGTRGW